MSLPLSFYGTALKQAYSGDLATSRYSAIHTDGSKIQVDVIQSVPNKNGRFRHVVRYVRTGPASEAPLAGGPAPATTVTMTVDHPTDQATDKVAAIIDGFTVMLGGNWDEIALGQQ